MRKSPGASIMDYFETLKDPRIERNRRHKLLDIIAIASAPPSAERIPGFTWSCSAIANWNGSRASQRNSVR